MVKKSLKGELQEAQDEGKFDPENRDKIFKGVALRFFGAMFILMAVMMIVLATYFGAMWDPQTKNLEVRIVNKDRGVVIGINTFSLGEIVQESLIDFRVDGERVLDFFADLYPDDRDEDYAEYRVVNNYEWGVLTIPENYTQDYLVALLGDQGEYDNPISYNYNQGRQKTTADAARNIVNGLIGGISKNVAIRAIENAAFPLNCSDVTAAALVDPVYLEIFISFPVAVNGYNFITYMGVNILWTVAASLLNVTMSVTHPLYGQFSIQVVHMMRFACMVICCFFQSLFFMCIVAAYADLDDFAHNFGAIWMYLFFVLLTFETLLVFLIRMVGIAGLLLLSPLLVLQVTTSNAIVHTDMLPSFYGTIGVGLPFYHAIEGLRFMVIGQTDSNIGTNLGVLAAYGVGFLCVNQLMWRLRVSKYIKENQHEAVVDAGTSAAIAYPSEHGKGFAGASF